jgi:hypothetical protein
MGNSIKTRTQQQKDSHQQLLSEEDKEPRRTAKSIQEQRKDATRKIINELIRSWNHGKKFGKLTGIVTETSHLNSLIDSDEIRETLHSNGIVVFLQQIGCPYKRSEYTPDHFTHYYMCSTEESPNITFEPVEGQDDSVNKVVQELISAWNVTKKDGILSSYYSDIWIHILRNQDDFTKKVNMCLHTYGLSVFFQHYDNEHTHYNVFTYKSELHYSLCETSKLGNIPVLVESDKAITTAGQDS